MAEKKVKTKSGAPRKRRKLAGKSIGLTAEELLMTASPNAIDELQQAIDGDGGKVLAKYREPFGGQWLVLAALPIDLVEPTPYQRNLSDTHMRKLEGVIAQRAMSPRRFAPPRTTLRFPSAGMTVGASTHRATRQSCWRQSNTSARASTCTGGASCSAAIRRVECSRTRWLWRPGLSTPAC